MLLSNQKKDIIQLLEIYCNLEFSQFISKLKLKFGNFNFNLKIKCVEEQMENNSFNWKKINDNPYQFAKKSSKKCLEECIKIARTIYYNESENNYLGDDQYDILEEYLKNN